jgi:hypothetical protein
MKTSLSKADSNLSTKKNGNVKEPILSSHTITLQETASTPFVSITPARQKGIDWCRYAWGINLWIVHLPIKN